MADYTERTEKYYVVKVSKRNNSIKYVSVNDYNGLLTERDDKDSSSFDDAQTANMLVGYLNNLYEKLGMDFYCYRVSNIENSTHIIRDLPDEYKAIVNEHFGVEETTDETTTGETTEPTQ